MAYITKNANLILLFLIVLIAASLVGATVYFQDRFSNINEQYDSKLAELNSLTAEAENYRQVLEKAQLELELKQSREEQFTEKFTTEKARAENLESEKDYLQDELADALSSLSLKTAEAQALTSQVTTLTSQVKSRDNKIDDLEEIIDCLESTSDSQEGDC